MDEEAIARANGRVPRETLERELAEFEAALTAERKAHAETRDSLIAAEALREDAEESLRLEEGRMNSLISLIDRYLKRFLNPTSAKALNEAIKAVRASQENK